MQLEDTFGKRLHNSTSSARSACLLTSAWMPARWQSTALASVKHATFLQPRASPFTSSSSWPADTVSMVNKVPAPAASIAVNQSQEALLEVVES